MTESLNYYEYYEAIVFDARIKHSMQSSTQSMAVRIFRNRDYKSKVNSVAVDR